MDERRQNWLLILIGIVAFVITATIVQITHIGSKHSVLFLWCVYCLELGLAMYGALNFSRLPRWAKVLLAIITPPIVLFILLAATIHISRAGVY